MFRKESNNKGKMTKLIGVMAVLLGFFLFLSDTCSAEEEVKAYKCVKIITPPVIDGKLDDECWKKKEKATDFTEVIHGKGLAADQTFVSIIYDEKNLYFGFECRESNMNEIVATIKDHDGRISSENSVEIFIDINNDQLTYYHFVVNSLGTSLEAKEFDKGWNVPWEVKIALGESAWFVEIAIPFSSLGVKPREGECWGLNLNRTRVVRGTRQYSCWSNTRGGFHAPKRFGHLVFNNYRINIERELSLLFKKKLKIEKLFESNPEEAKIFQNKFNQISKDVDYAKEFFSTREPINNKEFSKLYNLLRKAMKGYENLLYDVRFHILLSE